MENLATLPIVIVALMLVNLASFMAFGVDKLKAQAGQWRIAESTLLMLALFGGTPGAYAGRAAFRHKTRKQPFNSHLFGIAVLQLLGLGGALGWTLGG